MPHKAYNEVPLRTCHWKGRDVCREYRIYAVERGSSAHMSVTMPCRRRGGRQKTPPVILNGAAGGVKDLRYDNDMECVLQILRCAQNDRKDAQNDNGYPGQGEYKKGGADPNVSDVAPPPRSGGNLLSHPSGQYHRRWRA